MCYRMRLRSLRPDGPDTVVFTGTGAFLFFDCQAMKNDATGQLVPYGETVAMKSYLKVDENLLSELAANMFLAEAKTAGVVKMLDVLQNDTYVFMVLDLMEPFSVIRDGSRSAAQGPLQAVLPPSLSQDVDGKLTQSYFGTMAKSLSDLNEAGLFHLDVSLCNFLMVRGSR